MKRLLIAIVSSAIAASVVLPSQASSLDGTYNSVMQVVPPSIPSYGLVIDESLTGGSSTVVSRITASSLKNPLARNKVCRSVSDPHCADMDGLSVQLVLPPCSDGASRMCVEGLEVGTNGSALTKANLDHSVASTPTPADSTIGLAAGGSPSLWKIPSATHAGGSDTYGVIVSVSYFQGIKAPSKLTLQTLSASVVPVAMTPQYGNVAEIKEVVETFGPDKGLINYVVGMKDGATGPRVENLKCLWTELALCAQISSFAKESNVALTLRLNTDLTGWLFGRMKDVNVSTTQLDSKNNTLRIEAKPVDVLAAIGWVPKSEISKNPLIESFQKSIYNPGDGNYERVLAQPSSAWSGSGSSAGGFAGFTAYEPFLKPSQSQGERWLISSMTAGLVFGAQSATGNNASCLANTGKVLGIVTTNSMIYSPGPPELKDGALSYKVAGLHKDFNGEVFKGTYDLAMRSETARCIYGFSNAPIRASVSVLSSDGSTNDIASELVTEKNGWMTLSAKNFTFSSPTIRIKLSQSEKITTSAPAAPAKNEPAAQANNNSAKIKIIVCTKGKSIKKVSGTNPKCPSGFKKK